MFSSTGSPFPFLYHCAAPLWQRRQKSQAATQSSLIQVKGAPSFWFHSTSVLTSPVPLAGLRRHLGGRFRLPRTEQRIAEQFMRLWVACRRLLRLSLHRVLAEQRILWSPRVSGVPACAPYRLAGPQKPEWVFQHLPTATMVMPRDVRTGSRYLQSTRNVQA